MRTQTLVNLFGWLGILTWILSIMELYLIHNSTLGMGYAFVTIICGWIGCELELIEAKKQLKQFTGGK